MFCRKCVNSKSRSVSCSPIKITSFSKNRRMSVVCASKAKRMCVDNLVLETSQIVNENSICCHLMAPLLRWHKRCTLAQNCQQAEHNKWNTLQHIFFFRRCRFASFFAGWMANVTNEKRCQSMLPELTYVCVCVCSSMFVFACQRWHPLT